jgi:hypothetical protein
MKVSLLWPGAIAALVLACSSSSGTPGFGTGSGGGSGSGGSSSGGASSGGDGGTNGGSGSGSSSGSGGSGGGGNSSSGGGTSSSSSGGSSSSSSGSGSGGQDGGIASSYPPGPYGKTVGSVIENLKWIGYSDPAANTLATNEPYAAYSLDDARKSGMRYAMFNLGDFNCVSCQQSAMELASGAASVVAAGGVVIEVLTSTNIGASPATQTDLQNWINNFSLVNTTVKDPDGAGTYTLDNYGPREQAYIIDLSTMKIVDIEVGVIDGTPHSAGQGLSKMHMLLGK